MTNYRPQTKFGAKVIFLHLSVILFMGGGGIPACITGGIPACLAAGLQGGGIPACLAVLGGCPGPHPGGKLRGLARGGLQAHTQGGLQAHTWEGLQAHTWWGVYRPTPGGCIPACTEADTPPPPVDGYCHGRYASYWNAFLY